VTALAMPTPPSSEEAFRREVLGAGLLWAGTVDGVYGRSARYEGIVGALAALFTGLADDEAEDHVHFPPVEPRAVFEQTGYLSSFPNLMGSVHTFGGDDDDHAAMVSAAATGGPWAEELEPTEVMLCPASCHNLYPHLTGSLPPGGRTLQVSSWCFRHEPSRSLTRMQAFRMIESVYAGEPARAVTVRDAWLRRGEDTLNGLGLGVAVVPANDPFFGRRGRLLARTQHEDGLKFELVVEFGSDVAPVAVASSNLHLEHFGQTFGITTATGEVAHSTCFGWGMDRIALAMVHRHGTDPERWPEEIRTRLWP